jgi:hypothetical protein
MARACAVRDLSVARRTVRSTMSLSNIDTTRDLRTPDELRELVEAIHNSPANAQETNWLDWKSSLDLGTPEGRFAVAKAILGFANRSVEQVHLKCVGVAYMVVGVEPGAALGVTPVDHASLAQRIKTYADGPRWTPHSVPFSGVEVLVIVVEPLRARTRRTRYKRRSATTRPATTRAPCSIAEPPIPNQPGTTNPDARRTPPARGAAAGPGPGARPQRRAAHPAQR